MPLSPDSLDRFFGALELRVLEALWARRTAATVRDLEPEFAGVAYTTVMTTLDRLYRKGVLAREKEGRRFLYQPRLTRELLLSSVAGDALEAILGSRAAEYRPMVSFLLDAVRREDRDVLDSLDALIRERRRAEEESR
ncbi:MAG TPA: BlaI/MecI/CopY family transcriptional regulator [Vicinamibacterales bacterium]|nr:BlaI/MecI/CopY family transcriptional regulator [Vicinamibacterales bacterium]